MSGYRRFLLNVVAFAFTLCVASATIRNAPVIRTDAGLVSGVRDKVAGKDVDMYLGIPYAEPPIGPLRFSKPVPVEPWNGTLKATKRPKPCPQNIHYHTDEVSFYYMNNSEDCLYLNVRKPAAECKQASCDSKFPVVVFMHGGCFQWGDSGLFIHDGGNFAALTDTVFVSFNYRLNVFGFLSAGKKDVPGNWGLWDQNLVLTWVQRNIKNFGGDPREVTIIGHSAGGISAGFHAISPESIGLFKRMVLQSGSPMNIIASLSAHSVESVMELGSDLACDGVRERKLGRVMECLRKVDKNYLLGTLSGIDTRKNVYGPVHGDEYLPSDPLLLSTWKDNVRSKEIMIGTTAHEGPMFLYSAMKIVPQFKSLLSVDYRSTITVALSASMGIPVRSAKEITNAYFPDWSVEHNEDEVTKILSKILGDGLFVCPATIFADIASKQKIPVFRYVFDYRPSFSFWPPWFRVAHGDDLPFTLGSLVFYGDPSRFVPGIRHEDYPLFDGLKYTSEEEAFMKAMVTSMSQFVKTGKPSIPETQESWPRYSSTNPEYINIVPGNTTRKHGPSQDICKIWKRVLMKAEPEPAPEIRPKKQSARNGSRRSATSKGGKRIQLRVAAKQVTDGAQSSSFAYHLTVAAVVFVLSVHIAT